MEKGHTDINVHKHANTASILWHHLPGQFPSHQYRSPQYQNHHGSQFCLQEHQTAILTGPYNALNVIWHVKKFEELHSELETGKNDLNVKASETKKSLMILCSDTDKLSSNHGELRSKPITKIDSTIVSAIVE